MFVSINWIKDYVDLSGLDVKKLINSFTLATAEVEDIIENDIIYLLKQNNVKVNL